MAWPTGLVVLGQDGTLASEAQGSGATSCTGSGPYLGIGFWRVAQVTWADISRVREAAESVLCPPSGPTVLQERAGVSGSGSGPKDESHASGHTPASSGTTWASRLVPATILIGVP